MEAMIVGTGNMAESYARHLSHRRDVTLTSCLSRSGRTIPGFPAVPSISCIAQLPRLPDLAIVALPGFLHRQTVEALAPLVPNLICEKPAALCYEDALSMARTAQAYRCNLMIAHVVRVWDSFAPLAELLRRPPSPLHTLQISRRQPRPVWSDGNWLLDPAKSGGILYDLAIHDIDFVTNLFGPPREVQGGLGPAGESATVFLQYDGFSAVLQSSWCLPDSVADGGMETGWEAAFSQSLCRFSSVQGGDHYLRYDAQTAKKVPFPTWDGYSRQLSQMLEYTGRHQIGNPFSIETALPALAVCQKLAQ